ncbi:uncharacterized protein LOC114325101 [Diabrotica virgifera virgifera]|uniref:Uncharacterized protein LOC114325101 n=1 Tax=Diabrotica virgifera virgifera TaxID=50390 RepID=A0A6P7F5X3_DIAVI|nr:uncharacterized protein LOC114325101 [Diabrotica virgifera virgifera]
MNLKWINVNERLKNGVKLINSLSTKKFQLLLGHIVEAEGENPFTDEELKKLKDSLKLTEDALQLLVQSISHIFKQSSKVILKPTVLYKQLCEQLEFEDEKAEEFVKIWCNHTNEDFGDFSSRMKLENVSWELNIQVADQINNKQSVPVGRMQFELAQSVDNSKKERIFMEFTQSELQQLYNNLEKIQMKLDNINNVGH